MIMDFAYDTASGILAGLLVFALTIAAAAVWSIAFQLIFSGAGIKIMNKAGVDGNMFLIPVYGLYMFFKTTADSGVLYWSFLLMVGLGVLSAEISIVFGIYFIVLFLFFWIVFNINLGSAFDKPVIYGIKLALLPLPYYYLLANDDSRFVLNEIPVKEESAGQTT